MRMPRKKEEKGGKKREKNKGEKKTMFELYTKKVRSLSHVASFAKYFPEFLI